MSGSETADMTRNLTRYVGASRLASVARMERSGIRGCPRVQDTPHYATLHAGYMFGPTTFFTTY